MGEALDRGMVLVLSLWDDTDVSVLWLDSAYPTNEPADRPGVERGPCPGGAASEPKCLRSKFPESHVIFCTPRLGRSDPPRRTAAVVAWPASNTSEVHRHGKLAIS
mmetsp:Transcript_43312/g.109760  ORF Transcript_43312/g.109760 Transcript_43312/m.109760 type:complete len:106 (-) Transcript_43312:467-784(-)